MELIIPQLFNYCSCTHWKISIEGRSDHRDQNLLSTGLRLKIQQAVVDINNQSGQLGSGILTQESAGANCWKSLFRGGVDLLAFTQWRWHLMVSHTLSKHRGGVAIFSPPPRTHPPLFCTKPSSLLSKVGSAVKGEQSQYWLLSLSPLVSAKQPKPELY